MAAPQETQNQERFAVVASAIVHRSVGVRCQGFWERLVDVRGDDGSVDFDVAGHPSDEARLSE